MANDKGTEFNFPHLDRNPKSYSLDTPIDSEDKLYAKDAADKIFEKNADTQKRAQDAEKMAQSAILRTQEAIKSAQEAEKESVTDTLTGFENRRGLNNFKNSLKPEEYPLTILSIDLDNLKKINDNPSPETGGHHGGDMYILSFVKFTNEIFPNTKKFRLGGDEFAIPIQNSDPKELETIYQKLKEFNEKEQNQNNLEFTYAFDIASSKEDFYDALKRSDDKLVEAKKNKKNDQSQIPSSS